MTDRRDQLSASVPYSQGLHEVADGVFAYLQPDGGWGWSNAGLLATEWSSLLVDTLFDLNLTRDMLDAMAAVTAGSPIDTVVNTHANGDHCYGNSLLSDAGAQIVTSEAAAAEMGSMPPAAITALMAVDLGETTNRYVKEAFGPFEFAGIDLPTPDRTFSGELQLDVGGRTVELIEVGPAHTSGDLLVHLPAAGTVFCGDILFINGTPIIWDGPVANWIGACDRILDLGAEVIVPGHGPLTDAAGVTAVRDYLVFVNDECHARHAAGQSAAQAVKEIDLGPYAQWGEWERIAVNVHAIYREIDGRSDLQSPLDLFAAMAELKYGGK
ncbi:MAG TPA: MBL fold metallo-hydrolase [Acidimicrobiia bacterium]|jgi:glyoxylase-like metal-dependent hydrolase (beta-lactamase superfamily II)|nr:MBL fold metallo-hydrolase [Acidimicrobiia bacterium]HIL46363.1 MBL fold metallo-hydrolase [Acidimicrobiia bacterium]